MIPYLKAAISPGHGSFDPGCRGHGLTEDPIVYDIATRLHRTAKGLDWLDTLILREKHTDPWFAARDKRAKDFDADILISIHADSSANLRNNWAAAFHYPANKRVIPVCHAIVNAMPPELLTGRRVIGASINGNYPNAAYVVASYTPPTVLVETCFLSNADNAEFISKPSNRELVALGLINGLEKAAEIYGRVPS